MVTAQELLDANGVSLLACMKAQSSSARNRMLEMPRYEKLMAGREQLLQEIANGTNTFTLGVIDQPS